MSGTDFLALYQQLGLAPDCSADELKNAYRRRVAELHPDRHGDNPVAAARLQELTAAYTAAMRFSRRYDRLPGAHPRRPHPAGARPASRDRYTATSGPRGGLRLTLVGLALLAVLGGFLWNGLQDADQTTGNPAAEPAAAPVAAAPRAMSATVAQADAPHVAELELGMEASDVRRLEGRPVMESEARWDYGPSWIEFQGGRVSNWYSSKLRPLKVARARPQADAR